jgi:universal stress protein A
MPTFKTILCAVEFDKNSASALELGRELARQSQVPLHLVHVARIPTAYMDVPLPLPADPWWEQDARMKLDQLAREKLAGAVPYEIKVISGIPDIDIVREAGTLGADLIVMGTHGRTGVARLVLGSVARQVVSTAKCAVIVVKPEMAANRKTPPAA